MRTQKNGIITRHLKTLLLDGVSKFLDIGPPGRGRHTVGWVGSPGPGPTTTMSAASHLRMISGSRNSLKSRQHTSKPIEEKRYLDGSEASRTIEIEMGASLGTKQTANTMKYFMYDDVCEAVFTFTIFYFTI
jgi:hypothetical protein